MGYYEVIGHQCAVQLNVGRSKSFLVLLYLLAKVDYLQFKARIAMLQILVYIVKIEIGCDIACGIVDH